MADPEVLVEDLELTVQICGPRSHGRAVEQPRVRGELAERGRLLRAQGRRILHARALVDHEQEAQALDEVEHGLPAARRDEGVVREREPAQAGTSVIAERDEGAILALAA